MKTIEKEKIEVAPPTERVPIMIEFTEEDRQKAGFYMDRCFCLVGTALRRMGYPDCSVGADYVRLRGLDDIYRSDEILPSALEYDPCESERPYYGPGVVGKQVVLYPIDKEWPPASEK